MLSQISHKCYDIWKSHSKRREGEIQIIKERDFRGNWQLRLRCKQACVVSFLRYYLCSVSSCVHLEVHCRWRGCRVFLSDSTKGSRKWMLVNYGDAKVCWDDSQLRGLLTVDVIDFDVHMCRKEGKKIVRRDQRQTLYCHITGPCCILNSTNLSKQSDKILPWRDACSPHTPLTRIPSKWCKSRARYKNTKVKTTSTTTRQRFDRCKKKREKRSGER